MKIRPVEPSCSMRTDESIERQTDRQTDTTKLTVAFRSLSVAPKNSTCCSHCVVVRAISEQKSAFAFYKANRLVLYNRGGWCLLRGTD